MNYCNAYKNRIFYWAIVWSITPLPQIFRISIFISLFKFRNNSDWFSICTRHKNIAAIINEKASVLIITFELEHETQPLLSYLTSSIVLLTSLYGHQMLNLGRTSKQIILQLSTENYMFVLTKINNVCVRECRFTL